MHSMNEHSSAIQLRSDNWSALHQASAALNDRSQTHAIPAPDRCILEGHTMAKGKNSKKETKKPKQEKPKVSATANSQTGKPELSIAGRKVK